MKIAFIIDPLPGLDPGHDTSVALMEAAQLRGHDVWVTGLSELSVIDGAAWASLQSVTLTPVELVDDRWQIPQPWYQVGELQALPLSEFGAVFMRVDPPVTIPYLYATYILDLAQTTGVKVVNSPQGLRAANEKMYALQFESVIPRTIVSQDKAVIKQFLAEEKKAVLKPLGGKGGEGILLIEEGDRNFNSLIEISTQRGQEPVMVQRFLPEAKDGDKRVILLNGEPIGAVNRVPTGKEFRGNMAVGGRAEKADITARDREISAAVAGTLQRDQLYFVGLDVIGGYLTEVNVTSPTGVREIDRFNQSRIGDLVISSLEDA
ncbi:MAG: glutathione synthase [Cyanobacteria bacterium P01_H01_bin.15]